MKAKLNGTRIFGRNGGHAAQSVFKFGSVALVVFVIAMALMPLTANSAFAADDDDDLKVRQDSIQQVQQIQDIPLQLDPTPTPTPRVLKLDEPPVLELDDPPVLELVTPEGDPGLVSVYVNKLGCPQGFDAYGADIYGLAANCHDILNGVGFELHNSSGDIVFTHTGDIQDHMAVWDPIHEGDQTIEEVLPSGYSNQPRVFCKVDDSAEVEMGLTPTAVGFSITQHVDAGSLLWCDWFNVPNAGTADVYINKIGCPAGFDAYSADIYDLAYNCHEENVGVPFTVNTTVGPITQNTGNLPPSLSFEDITAGDISITEDLPDGYGQPRVFCKVTDAALNESAETEQTVDPSGPTINSHLNDQEMLWCDWLNIPESDNGDITIWKFDCPVGTDPLAADESYFATECTTPKDGVEFTVSDGVNPDLTGTTGAGGVSGEVKWTDVPAGSLTITESIPTGYFDPVVYCGFSYTIETEGGLAIADGIVPVASAPGGVLEHEFQPKESLGCWWYNIPRGDDTEITIYKYTCPEGYDMTELGANPKIDCPTLTDGINFTLKHDGAVDLLTATGDSIPGAVYWGGLEADDYHVVEELPEGTVAILVNCTTTTPEGLPYKFSFTPGVDNPVIDLTLVKGQVIICHWFNDPYDEPDGGELKVNKYWCTGAVYSVEACDLYTGSASFVLTSASGKGDPISFNTSGDGTHELYLKAGVYDLEEQPGPWCYATADYTDAEGNLVIHDGYTTTVDVFNCGPNDGGKEPPVKKYPNTGVGPTVAFERWFH